MMNSKLTAEIDVYFRWVPVERKLSKFMSLVAKHIERHKTENGEAVAISTVPPRAPHNTETPCAAAASSNDTDSLQSTQSSSDDEEGGLQENERWKQTTFRLEDGGVNVFDGKIPILGIEKTAIEPLYTITKCVPVEECDSHLVKENMMDGSNLSEDGSSMEVKDLPRKSGNALSAERVSERTAEESKVGAFDNNSNRNLESWYMLWLQVRSPSEGCVRRFFYYSRDNKAAKHLAEQLCGVVDFINKLKSYFTSMRQVLFEVDAIQKQWSMDLAEKRKKLKKLGNEDGGDSQCLWDMTDNVLQFQKSWYDALPVGNRELLKVGFGDREQSLLEEAVAYAPVSVFLFLPSIPLLLDIPFSGQRLAHDIRELSMKLRKHYPVIDPFSSAAGKTPINVKSFYGASTSEAVSKSDASQQTGRSSMGKMQLFHLRGGELRLPKSQATCEDATLCMNKEGILGIFDGVGSWSLEGIDASKFSIGLAEECQALAPQLLEGNSFNKLNANGKARLLLHQAHQNVKRNRPDAWGSSTAVVAVFDGLTGTLGVSCLGDSMLMILRRDTMPRDIWSAEAECPKVSYQTLLGSGPPIPRKMRRIVWKTKVQQWENGAPYQLANLPDSSVWEDLRAKGYDRFVNTLNRIDLEGDSSDMAFSPRLPIVCHPGDLILAFSDGVSDNLFEKEVESYCTFAISPEEALLMGDLSLATPPEDIASIISMAAHRRSKDRPFKEAFVPLDSYTENRFDHYSQAGSGAGLKGAKKDDISCVACWVVAETEDSMESLLQNELNHMPQVYKPEQQEIVEVNSRIGKSEADNDLFYLKKDTTLCDEATSTPTKRLSKPRSCSTYTPVKTSPSKVKEKCITGSDSVETKNLVTGGALRSTGLVTGTPVRTPVNTRASRTTNSPTRGNLAMLARPRLSLPKVTTPRRILKIAPETLLSHHESDSPAKSTPQPKTPTGVTVGRRRNSDSSSTPTSITKQKPSDRVESDSDIECSGSPIKHKVLSPFLKRKDVLSPYHVRGAFVSDMKSALTPLRIDPPLARCGEAVSKELGTPVKQNGRKRTLRSLEELAMVDHKNGCDTHPSEEFHGGMGVDIEYGNEVEFVSPPYDGGMTPRKVKRSPISKRKRTKR